MCGICGVVGIESREVSEALVRRMMAAIVHRGPDAEGILVAPPVVAGSRRLSIIDLPGGSQPVWNETKTLAVVYNGEIYNFRELRKELEAAGHKFRTHSDTEVVVHAYETWGEKCVGHFEGMFAFAIVEMPQGPAAHPARVFLARDKLGIKPLYYSLIDGHLFFASEVRALLASGAVTARLSRDAISSYLLFGSVSEPITLVEGISSIPPGHFVNVRVGEPIRAISPQRYWSAPQQSERATTGSRTGSAASVASHVRELLEHAVASHLIADVPVGVFLSSGLDSTAIAALANRAQSGIHTFTVAFPDLEFSEAEIARRTAERLGTSHSEFTLSGDEMLARLDEAVASFDQPSMDGINTYFVSWAARQAGLKVALSGLGSDELFGGYASFRDTRKVARLAAAARWMPKPLRKMLTPQSQRAKIPGASPDAFRKASAAWIDPSSLPHAYFFTRSLFTAQVVSQWLHENEDTWKTTSWGQWLAEAVREARAMDEFTSVSWLELRSYLVNTLLRDTDSMSMRHSLEVRVPFLDSRLVEYVLSLPEAQKLDRNQPKALLIAALGNLLPQELVSQKKRTFTFPWENWLRGALRERVAAGFADWSPALDSVLSADDARQIWNDFLAGKTTWSRPWSLFVLNEWVKRNLCAPQTGNSERGKTAAVSVA